jgi:hypothetical protein
MLNGLPVSPTAIRSLEAPRSIFCAIPPSWDWVAKLARISHLIRLMQFVWVSEQAKALP